MGYDAVYNLEGVVIDDEEARYEYDYLNQLIQEKGHTYENDSLYNRTRKDGIPYQLNALNQLTCQSETEYVYDSNGNLVKIASKGPTQLLYYDALDRLISVEDGEERTFYEYDGFNRRMSKTNGESKEEYLYDGRREIASYRDGRPFVQRILGRGIDSSEIHATIGVEREGAVYLPLHNPFGHLGVLIDGKSGEIVERLHTTAFGEGYVIDSEGNTKTFSECLSPWIVSSKRYDPETGFTLYGLRYYCPEIGRWITTDPAGFADGPNLYAYVKNNPLIYVDLYGLGVWKGVWKGAKMAAPFVAVRLVIYGATFACPPLGGALNAAMTVYNAYSITSLGVNVGGYVATNLTNAANLGEGVAKMGGEVASAVQGVSGEDWIAAGTNFLVNRKMNSIEKKASLLNQTAGKAAAVSQTAGKVNSVANGILKNSGSGGDTFLKIIPGKNGIPSLDQLSKAGQMLDRNGLTRAGRALDKHGNRPGSVFPKAFGDIANKNALGQYHLDDILTHPETFLKIHYRPKYGEVLDF